MVLRAIFKMAANENGINFILIFNYHREANLVSKLILSRFRNTMGAVFFTFASSRLFDYFLKMAVNENAWFIQY